MDANAGLAAILRDAARRRAAPQDEVGIHSLRMAAVDAALAAIYFGRRLSLRLGLRVTDGLGQHLAQLSLGLRRFLREGFLPLCHPFHMGMPEGELNPRWNFAADKSCLILLA
ncbi:MAG TPA: hypothetical protein VD863_21770 [Bradyrhizobium sp.]|jgi:hypothetical protein|nr:hypothetical protein [Bradyrhizobium sp.]